MKKRALCLNCGKYVKYTIEQAFETMRTETGNITYKRIIPKCRKCGDELYVSKIDEANLTRLDREYKKFNEDKVKYITDKDKEIARLTAENERLSKQLTDSKCIYLSDSETEEGCVQSPCPNYKTVEDILKENAELHARLKKAVILPCKVGDTVYWIEKWRTEPQIDEYTVHGFMIDTTNEKVCIRVKLDKNGFFVPLVGEYKDKQLFFDRTKAEARLAELKGGEQE